MDDEIDLRQQVAILLRHWKLILLLTLIGAAAAAVFSFILPNVYEAAALVSVSPPRYTLRLEGVEQAAALPVGAYPELAMSDDVLAVVYDQARATLPANVNTLSRFAERLRAEAASDSTLLRLSVRDSDPARAAAIANAWVAVFSARAGQLYGQDQAALAVYQQELAKAQAELEQADAALAAFQASNQVNVLSAQLASQQAILTDLLNRQQQLALMQQDLGDLSGRLQRLAGDAPASLAEDLALLSLASRLYGGELATLAPGQNTGDVQLQVGSDRPLVGPTIADQLDLAGDLQAALAARREQVAGQIAALEPEILALQGQVAAAQVQEQELTRARDLASSQYLNLARRTQEAEVAVQAWANTVQVASQAAVPTEKAGPRRALNTLLGTALGFGLGVVLALATQLGPLAPAPAPASAPARPGRTRPLGEGDDGRAAQPAPSLDKPA
jgi:uncharacterized protein involved in exopolysaccharide biosynthesis